MCGINLVGIANSKGGELSLPYPQAECLACDTEDVNGLG